MVDATGHSVTYVRGSAIENGLVHIFHRATGAEPMHVVLPGVPHAYVVACSIDAAR